MSSNKRDLVKPDNIRLSGNKQRILELMLSDLSEYGVIQGENVSEFKKAITFGKQKNFLIHGGFIVLGCCEALCKLNGLNPYVKLEKTSDRRVKEKSIVDILYENEIISLPHSHYLMGFLLSHKNVLKNKKVDISSIYAEFGIFYLFIKKAHDFLDNKTMFLIE